MSAPRHKWSLRLPDERIGNGLFIVEGCPHCRCRRARPFGSNGWGRIAVAACYYRRPGDPDWMRKSLWVEIGTQALPACVAKSAAPAKEATSSDAASTAALMQ